MLRIAFLLVLATGAAARAQGPAVVADIAPVAALVSIVTGEPIAPLVPEGASPHDYRLRPSDAAALGGAALVVRVGAGLSPWLDRSLPVLAPQATDLVLAELPGTLILRADADQEDHDDDGHEDHGDDGHGADDDHDRDAADDHGHGGMDPHPWLDLENGRLWLDAIAAEMARLDPERAPVYAANAAAGRDRLAAMAAAIGPRVAGARFVSYHDAYGYFSNAFGVQALAHVSDSEARDPSPHAVSAARSALMPGGCLLMDASAKPGIVATVTEGLEVRIVAADPLGQGLPQGPGLYEAILARLADGLSACRE